MSLLLNLLLTLLPIAISITILATIAKTVSATITILFAIITILLCDCWWPSQAIGGEGGQEIYNALAPLSDFATRGQFLISFHSSLVFDFCDPPAASSRKRVCQLACVPC